MRTELDQLRQAGYMFEDPFDVIHMFERKICAYTNAPMCVVVDSDTHALELCLRYYLEQGIYNKAEVQLEELSLIHISEPRDKRQYRRQSSA